MMERDNIGNKNNPWEVKMRWDTAQAYRKIRNGAYKLMGKKFLFNRKIVSNKESYKLS